MFRILGLVLLVFGIVLLFWGVAATESLTSEISRLFTGTPTQKSIWLVAGGVASVILGLGFIVFSRRAPPPQ